MFTLAAVGFASNPLGERGIVVMGADGIGGAE